MHSSGFRRRPWTGWARAVLVGGGTLIAATAGATSSGTVPVCRDGAVEMLVGGAGAHCDAGLGPENLVRGRRGASTESPAATADAAASAQVPAQVQRQRDRDRQAILQQELGREQQALSTLLRAGAQADPQALRRTRDNLSALQRELGQATGVAAR